MKKTDIKPIIIQLAIGLLIITSCNKQVGLYETLSTKAVIYPEYMETVIPPNIAPINFIIREDAARFIIRFAVAGKDSFEVASKGKTVIPVRKWKKLLSSNSGEQMVVQIFAKKSSGWLRYEPIRFTLAREPIDPYLVYRLIEPGYEGWNRMGIYQRCLENYNETPIIVNTLTDNSCMNCHTFCNGNPNTFLFHLRQQIAGTVILKEGQLSKVNTKAEGMISAGVYPRWHPQGRYVAFSANTTRQGFHSSNDNKVEVYDKASDIYIYDTENGTMFTDSLICSSESFETFPEWSPDGKYLYFCSAPACPMPQLYDSIQYALMRIAFDTTTGHFGAQVDTLVSPVETGKSVSLARVSPDNKYIVFCMSAYGAFPIWHRDNDLYLLHLETGEITNMATINSDQSDSYHAWSSNGRWLVLSSRRMDGAYSRPYISYFDSEGNAYPPFLLPRKDPLHYDFSTKSYNLPEFTTGKVPVSPYSLAKAAKGEAIKAKMR